MKIQPYIIGSGRAAQALERSLFVLGTSDPDLATEKAIYIKRDQSLKGLAKEKEISILLIANPHGLHAKKIIEAENEKFSLIIVEKPVCISLAEVEQLQKVRTPVAVCHGYRQMWGIQTMKKMLQAGEFGKIISIEGRYWQSSAAQRVLLAAKPSAQSWKNDSHLSGPHDALLDIAPHWADAAFFLAGEMPTQTRLWLSYVNAEAAHRDTHIHLQMNFPSRIRALASISKTVHGAANHFEINLLGEKKSATWNFMDPDHLAIGEGGILVKISRSDTKWGSGQPAFHALGWLEGYIEILRQSLRQVLDKNYEKYPTLADSANTVTALLQSEKI